MSTASTSGRIWRSYPHIVRKGRRYYNPIPSPVHSLICQPRACLDNVITITRNENTNHARKRVCHWPEMSRNVGEEVFPSNNSRLFHPANDLVKRSHARTAQPLPHNHTTIQEDTQEIVLKMINVSLFLEKCYFQSCMLQSSGSHRALQLLSPECDL